MGAVLHVRGVEGQAGEGQAANQIAEHGRDLVPDEIVQDRERRVEHQPRREQEHVHDGMLEDHVEEDQDRHPHRDDLAGHGRRYHGADDAGRNHPVAQHAAEEQRRHAGCAVGCIAERPGFADVSDDGADLVRRLREAERRHECHQKGRRESAGKSCRQKPGPSFSKRR